MLFLFTGDAGQGESNVRSWIIENDYLEAIVMLPLNIFHNIGIAAYIWVLANHQPKHRQGKVRLIDATQWFKPLRKSLGKENCEPGEADPVCLQHLASVNETSRTTTRKSTVIISLYTLCGCTSNRAPQWKK